MCRHVAWLGAPRTLSSVLLEPAHGLLRQSYAPRRQAHGTMNADGWGCGFYPPGAGPARWRGDGPLWAEQSFASVAPHVRAAAILGAVRSATVGMPVDATAAAPFARGRWLLSHNGVVERAVLPAEAWAGAESVCDAAVLASYLLEAPEELGARVAKVGLADPGARLNILATDGDHLVATVWGDVLSVLETDDGVAVASEPWDDDPRWADVPDHSLLTVTDDGAVSIEPLERQRVTVTVDRHLDADTLAEQMRTDVRAGLTATPKTLPSTYFYDEPGSDLFDAITRLPEYYPTRREAEILTSHAGEIAARGFDTLVELGSGTSEKTRTLLDALSRSGSLRRFVPFDVDDVTLLRAGEAVSAEYPGVDVHAVVGDFTRHVGELPTGGRRLVAFLGSTIGNFTPGPRAAFLAGLAATFGPDDALLLGTDLVKDPARLVAAYDDSQGVTAAFNRNVLYVLDRELKADFDPDAFAHRAVWNAAEERMEMWLEARTAQEVQVGALDLEVAFAAGEAMRTEVSSKFTRERAERELGAAGLRLAHWWTDTAGDFALSLAVPA